MRSNFLWSTADNHVSEGRAVDGESHRHLREQALLLPSHG